MTNRFTLSPRVIERLVELLVVLLHVGPNGFNVGIDDVIVGGLFPSVFRSIVFRAVKLESRLPFRDLIGKCRILDATIPLKFESYELFSYLLPFPKTVDHYFNLWGDRVSTKTMGDAIFLLQFLELEIDMRAPWICEL